MRAVKRKRRPVRLKTTLLVLLVPTVLALLLFDSWSDYRTLHETTDAAYDRALLGPALALSNSAVATPQGDVRLDVPQLALAMLESAPGQRVYYRVTVIDTLPMPPPVTLGDTPMTHAVQLKAPVSIMTEVAGMRDLAMPEVFPSGVEPVFYNSVYRGDPVRVVALSRPLRRQDVWGEQLVIQVGESISGRWAQQAEAWTAKQSRNLVIIVVLVIMMLLGVYWAMAPLGHLRSDLLSRARDDLTPLDATRVPHEIAPLVHAINHHIRRLSDVFEAQSQFLADASHQLRTPLAIMRMQAEYALREPGTPRTRASLLAILEQLERSGRLTGQLLALAHARHGSPASRRRVLDARSLLYELTLQHLPLAHSRHQDLGWDETSPDQPLMVEVVESAVTEALSNLIHNAVRYTPEGGSITVSAHEENGYAVLCVRDTGPGIAPEMRQRAFERFQRGNGQAGDGAGLGLAIAHEFIKANRGHIELRDGDPNTTGGRGLCVRVCLPLHHTLDMAPPRLT